MSEEIVLREASENVFLWDCPKCSLRIKSVWKPQILANAENHLKTHDGEKK